MRVAVIDIGTNTVLLLVADRARDGLLTAVVERATITRLGAGVDATGTLAPASVQRTCNCLKAYADLIATLRVDRTVVAGTSAMRDAKGREAVVACVDEALGVDTRVLSGSDEARLTFRGAVGGLRLDDHQEIAVFDIGGGSTEIAIGRNPRFAPELSYTQSFDLGSVRLTDRYIIHDPPTTSERDAVVGAARASFTGVPQIGAGVIPVGVAGTVTTLAAIHLGIADHDGARVHGETIERTQLRHVVDRIASLPLKDRRNIPGIHPMRADVIVAGGLIAIELLDHWQADSFRVSDRGLRWGLADELTIP